MSGWAYILIALAAAMGAAGVIEAAAAAHGHVDPLLDKASQFLLLDAAAAIGFCAIGLHATARRSLFFLAASLLLAGGALFCGDLTLRSLTGARLFPMAAPIGGTTMIIAWIVAAAAAICGYLKRS